MPYSGQFLKVTWLFSISGTDEIADTGLNFTTAPGWTGAVAALAELESGADFEALYPLMPTLLASMGWADYSRLDGIKVAAIGTDGKYLAEPLVYEDGSPSQGSNGSILPQSTVVLSLRSGFTIGSGNYGRMYLPHTALGQATSTPYGSPTVQAAAAAAGKVFLNDAADVINDAITATVFPAIMGTKGSGTGKGVTSVAVGRVVDTQRRRRNRLTENYIFQSLA